MDEQDEEKYIMEHKELVEAIKQALREHEREQKATTHSPFLRNKIAIVCALVVATIVLFSFFRIPIVEYNGQRLSYPESRAIRSEIIEKPAGEITKSEREFLKNHSDAVLMFFLVILVSISMFVVAVVVKWSPESKELIAVMSLLISILAIVFSVMRP